LAVFHALLGDDDAPDPLGPATESEPDVTPILSRVKSTHSL
ncbi:MAG: histone deacetylase, partial [Chloroflexi bacterium]|nr:histone deacetylase [Chloroflexota bacterium]